MLNAAAKMFNRMPKANSKTQQKKAMEKKPEPVKCSKCGLNATTLYRADGAWFCKEHRPKPKYDYEAELLM